MKLGYVLMALALSCSYPAAKAKPPVKHDSSEVKPKPKSHDDHKKVKHQHDS